jgi:gliding motility-associated-like protein
MNKRFVYIIFINLVFLLRFFNAHASTENNFSHSAGRCVIFGLPAPELRCVSVSANGNVTLSWKEVFDTSSTFNSYHIFSSASALGPFMEIDSIFNISQTTYTDGSANANLNSIYYYIETRSFCRETLYSTPSDTLQTILMSAGNTGLGTALLTWNPIHNPNLPSSYGWYYIYKEYPIGTGTWTMIDSTKSLSYIDTITVCHAQINYYVAIDDSLPCTSRSSINGGIFEDVLGPVSPKIDSVSVDPVNGRSVIGWTPSRSGDTKGYIIYQNVNGSWVAIDTVIGINNTLFINNLPHWSNPDSSSLSYCIKAIDSCKMTGLLDSNQNSIYLNSIYDICGRSVKLNWTPYVNMPNGLKGYNIYVKQNNGPLKLLGTNSSANLSFTLDSLAKNSTYVFVVQASNGDGTITSSSNTDTVIAYAPAQPKFVYLRHATVINSDYVEIKALIDTSAFVSMCKILRADSATPFTNIGSASPVAHSNIVTYNDHSAMVNTQSYYYKVVVDDSCGNDVDTSNIGRTIFLTAQPASNMKNILTWNEYEMWLGSVKEYNVYREVDGVWENNPVATIAPGTDTYSDDVSSFTSSEGKFGYMVVADEGPGNPYMIADTSVSNIAISLQPPRLYIPNAFVPQGVNKIFIPVNVFVTTANYQFSIYNNWGTLIFQTTDTQTGWNGTYKGSLVQEGVYVYVVRFENSDGQMMENAGTVTLIR